MSCLCSSSGCQGNKSWDGSHTLVQSSGAGPHHGPTGGKVYLCRGQGGPHGGRCATLAKRKRHFWLYEIPLGAEALLAIVEGCNLLVQKAQPEINTCSEKEPMAFLSPARNGLQLAFETRSGWNLFYLAQGGLQLCNAVVGINFYQENPGLGLDSALSHLEILLPYSECVGYLVMRGRADGHLLPDSASQIDCCGLQPCNTQVCVHKMAMQNFRYAGKSCETATDTPLLAPHGL